MSSRTKRRRLRSTGHLAGRRRRRNGMWIAALVGGAAVLGVVGLSLLGLSQPPDTNAAGRPSGTPRSSSHAPTSSPRPSPSVLPRSAPTRLTIPAIGVNGPLQRLGVGHDHTTMQLPSKPTEAGWYANGATPGQAGPTIVVGYITGRHGPGVFHRLAGLRPGATVDLTRTDHRTVVYRVDRIASYTTKSFPASTVYAASASPTLRIITCGGTLHPGDKPGNVVVFAHQLRVQPATPAPVAPPDRSR